MEKTYEELLEYDIYRAIELKGKNNRKYKTIEEYQTAIKNDPAIVPNNPLLRDYNWVYEHAEELFCRNMLDYQKYQSTEEYFILFKALINKYQLEDDYRKYENYFPNPINMKWELFAIKLIEFISHSLDDKLSNLLEKEDVINYFLKYPKLYDHETIASFNWIGIEKFLKYPYYSSYYTKNPQNLISLIRKNPKITIPLEITLDDKVIKKIARTHKIEDFYFNLIFISEQVCEQPYLDEHKKYCDEQISNIKKGILPCYEEEYDNSPNEISLDNLPNMSFLQTQVVERIFSLNGLTTLPKKYFYQELSKYMIVGMFISRNYETDPHNLLIDIETLHEFAKENNKELEGQEIYDFLTSFESQTTDEIISFYNQTKTLPLKEILYDDWENQKNEFIQELNSNLFDISNLEPQTASGVTYYDISDIEEPIIVHNTSIPIDDSRKIENMLDTIKQGYKGTLCLSVQDQNHQEFYEEEHNKNKKTIKLAYGKLSPNRVGTICHDDAYSQGKNEIEIENMHFKRRHYTLKNFMDKTTDYNEIVYVIEEEPFFPIGIICEEEITDEEINLSKELNVPLLYRKNKKSTKQEYQDEYLPKRYKLLPDHKKLFKD